MKLENILDNGSGLVAAGLTRKFKASNWSPNRLNRMIWHMSDVGVNKVTGTLEENPTSYAVRSPQTIY
jgi:hypothetical protein